jgi:hypothetical protein
VEDNPAIAKNKISEFGSMMDSSGLDALLKFLTLSLGHNQAEVSPLPE